MQHEATATRKRPGTFDGLVGQRFVVETLKNAINTGSIAHAYLFSGPRGVGKTSAARILARSINCPEGPSTDCDAPLSAMDVIEIDGASNTSVNDVRALRDEVLFAPAESRYKVYIIDEVHMLSTSAFNALLKTIEEPPDYVVFVFATTEIHKVPATIRSRCQHFNFRLIPPETIREKLGEACKEAGRDADEAALAWIAEQAEGSLRDGYTLLDQVLANMPARIELEPLQEHLGALSTRRVGEIVAALHSNDAVRAFELTEEAILAGSSVERIVVGLAEVYRGLLLRSCGVNRRDIVGIAAEAIPSDLIPTRGKIEFALDVLLQLYRNIRYSLRPRTELELVLARLAMLDRMVTYEDVGEAIWSLRAQLLRDPGSVSQEATSPASSDHNDAVPREDPQAEDQPAETEGSPALSLAEQVTVTNPTLAALLRDGTGVRFLEDGVLSVEPTGRFAEETFRGALTELREAASSLWQHVTKVTIAPVAAERTDDTDAPDEDDESEASLVDRVKRVFRGQEVKEDTR